jgi:hypothetical protein
MNGKFIGFVVDDQFVFTVVQKIQSSSGIIDTYPCIFRHFQGSGKVLMITDTKIQ